MFGKYIRVAQFPVASGHGVRELGRLERTQFMLQWLQDPALRRRVHVGLNKGEAQECVGAGGVFNRLGELRDRRYENQRHRASGLNLVIAAIVLWNTVCLERFVAASAGAAKSFRTSYWRTYRRWAGSTSI